MVEAILEAAARILGEEGWVGFNTNAIAARAGVSIGSVYEYFADKQAILDQIVARHLHRAETLLAAATEMPHRGGGPDALVDALVAGFVDVHRGNPRLHRALSTEVPLTAAHQAHAERLRTTAIELVRQRLGESTATARIRATLLVDTADALTHRWLVDPHGQPLDPDIMARELAAMLRAYLSGGAD